MEEEILNDMPMHYAYFRKNEDCSLPDSEIESRIPNSVREATTFEELYTSLANMKIDLESNPTIESVDVTMDVPDEPTGDKEEVMVNFDIKEMHGLCTHWLFDTSKEQNDYSGIDGTISNPTNHLDSFITAFKYDLIHGNRLFSATYSHPRGFFGLPVSIAYLKTYNNYLQESGVSVYRDYVHATVSNRKNSVSARCFIGLRDLSPQGDVEEERILHSHCSRSMLNECHPSVASGIAVAYKYNTENDELLPTEGSRLKSTLVTWNGLVGDVHSLQFSVSGATTIPIIHEIAQEPGLLLHLKGVTGMSYALGKKRIRFVDRYFLNASHVHGYARQDFGPRSKPEEGGRKEGDALGGDTCCAVSAALTLPVVLSMDYSYGIRAKLFYELGNVWNHASTSWRDVWNSSRSCLGVGVSLPLFGSALVDVSYLVNQKKFAFSVSVL